MYWDHALPKWLCEASLSAFRSFFQLCLSAMKDHNATSMSGVTHDFGDLNKLLHSMCLSAFRYCSIHGERIGCHFRKFCEMHTYGDELMGKSTSSLCFFRSRNAAGPSGRPRVYTTCLLCVGICITGCYRIPKMSALSTAWWVFFGPSEGGLWRSMDGWIQKCDDIRAQ